MGRRAQIAAMAGAALLPLAGAQADPLPMPQADYAAVVKFTDLPEPVTIRHHGGLFRLEFEVDGRKQAVLVDPQAQLATVLEEVKGKMTAMEMPAAPFNIPKPGEDIGASKVGTDAVNGESCDVWRRPLPEADLVSEICVAADGIPLRVTRPGEEQPLSVVTSLERAAQDAALFVVPADAEKLPPTDTP